MIQKFCWPREIELVTSRGILRIGLVVAIFAGSLIVASGQTKVRDSLRKVLQGSKNIPDTSRLRLLIDLAELYERFDPDSTLLYCRAAKEWIGNKKNFAREEAVILRLIGSVHTNYGRYDSAKIFLHRAQSKTQPAHDDATKKQWGLIVKAFGYAHDFQGNYDSAIYYYDYARQIFEGFGDQIQAAGCVNNVGTVYEMKGNYPLALQYYLRAITKADDRDHPYYAMVMINIARMHFLLKEYSKAKPELLEVAAIHKEKGFNKMHEATAYASLYELYSAIGIEDSAVYFARQSMKTYEELGFKDGIAESHHNLGLIYKNKKNWNRARNEAEIALGIFEQTGVEYGKAYSTLLLSEAHFYMGNPTTAIASANKGLAGVKKLNAKTIERGYLELLSSMHASQKNFPLAYSYSQQLIAIKDSINNEEKIKQVANMEALYENDKKEKELAVVRAEKLTADAQLSEQQTRSTLLIEPGFPHAGHRNIFLYRLEEKPKDTRTEECRAIKTQPNQRPLLRHRGA
jgi:tetratricopeptide (TPR) repeat protein